MAQNYEINYDDPRFAEVESDKNAALNEVDVTYGNMIADSDKYFQNQIEASQKWENEQSQIQQEKTDFAIEKIEQDKAQAKKDYTKEQSGAYADWKKQSNQYGANAEQMASSGMTSTGYSESSQVSMYNTYQNRVTAAREAYNQVVLNYNNAITDARLQNNSILAEIAAEAQEKQLELALQGFQYKNQLITEKANKRSQIDSEYYGRYQDVLNQINTENALAEEVRQYNELAEERRQFGILHSGSISGGSGGSGGSSGGGSGSGGNTINKGSGSSGSSGEIKQNSSSGGMSSATKQSILALGQGPISAANLAKQVASGKVTETTNSKGETVFKPANKPYESTAMQALKKAGKSKGARGSGRF